jgi:hypothetical protein
MEPQQPGGRVLAARRADAGSVRLGARDITGLVLCAEHYGAPYDVLAAALDVRPDRLRGIVARWRKAGYASTGTLGPGPAWCWLTPAGMAVTGLTFPAARPALSRLAHVRAVLAVRLWLQDGEAYQAGRAWWRSERRIRAAAGRIGTAHVPDAEIHWPSLDASPYAGQVWAVEAELTPKPLARTVAIMRGLLARASDYRPGSDGTGHGPRYAQVVYLAAPAARPVVDRAIGALPGGLAARVVARDLPEGALL